MYPCARWRLAVALAKLFKGNRTRTQNFDVSRNQFNLATSEGASQTARTKIEVRLSTSTSTSANSGCGEGDSICRAASRARSNHTPHDLAFLCDALAPKGGRHSPHSRFTGAHIPHYNSGLYARCKHRTGEGTSPLSPEELACLDTDQKFRQLRSLIAVDQPESETRTYFCNRGICRNLFHCRCERFCPASISQRCGTTSTTTDV